MTKKERTFLNTRPLRKLITRLAPLQRVLIAAEHLMQRVQADKAVIKDVLADALAVGGDDQQNPEVRTGMLVLVAQYCAEFSKGTEEEKLLARKKMQKLINSKGYIGLNFKEQLAILNAYTRIGNKSNGRFAFIMAEKDRRHKTAMLHHLGEISERGISKELRGRLSEKITAIKPGCPEVSD